MSQQLPILVQETIDFYINQCHFKRWKGHFGAVAQQIHMRRKEDPEIYPGTYDLDRLRMFTVTPIPKKNTLFCFDEEYPMIGYYSIGVIGDLAYDLGPSKNHNI